MNQTDKPKVTVIIIQDLNDGVNDVSVYSDPDHARRETSVTLKRLVKDETENYPDCGTTKAWSKEIHAHLQKEEYDDAFDVFNNRCHSHGGYIEVQEEVIR